MSENWNYSALEKNNIYDDSLFKSHLLDDQNRDMECDKIALYTGVRVMMARVDEDAFGPVGAEPLDKVVRANVKEGHKRVKLQIKKLKGRYRSCVANETCSSCGKIMEENWNKLEFI